MLFVNFYLVQKKRKLKSELGKLEKFEWFFLRIFVGGGEGMIGIEIFLMLRVEVLLWFCWMQKGGNVEQMLGKS